MKKYIRNPKFNEVHDVRGKKRQEAIEQENEQQDKQSSQKDGE
jgi:beta-lactam-binding protein with PASTA domain